jgi:predicted ribosomally synthesized peptide with SipW-like signal peptide
MEREEFMNRSAAKKTLFASAAALSLSTLLFAGTTYAWFTDSVSSGVSTVKSGNLDIVLEVRNSKGEWVEVDNTVDVFNPDGTASTDLWEPGHTQTAYLRVRNNGSLSLKYDLDLVASATKYNNVYNDSTNLADHIVYGIQTSDSEITEYTSREAALQAVADGTVAIKTTAENTASVTGTARLMSSSLLKPSDGYEYLAVVAYMPNTVGNEANWDSADGTDAPSITYQLFLSAGQTEDEEDSFGSNYDKSAVLTRAALLEAQGYQKAEANTVISTETFANGPVVLEGDAKMNLTSPLNSDFVVDLNGNTLEAVNYFKMSDSETPLMISMSNGTLEMNSMEFFFPSSNTTMNVEMENMTFTGDNENYVQRLLWFKGNTGTSTFVFKNCTFDEVAVQFMPTSNVEGLNIVFDNCTFKISGTNVHNVGQIHIGSLGQEPAKVSFNDCTFDLYASDNLYAIRAERKTEFTFTGTNTVNGTFVDGVTDKTISLFEHSATWYGTSINGVAISGFVSDPSIVLNDPVVLTN